MRRLAMAGLAAAVLATGCVLIPIPTDLPENPSSEDLALLRKGTTTRADMVRLLGPPQLEVGDRQALWSYRHEKGRIHWFVITLLFGGADAEADWGRDEDLAVLATFDGGGRLESLEWAASDGRRGRPLDASATAAPKPTIEPEALPWAKPGIEAMAPDGRTALVHRDSGPGLRLLDRQGQDVMELPAELCSAGIKAGLFLRTGVALVAASGYSPCSLDLTTAPPGIVHWPANSRLSREAMTLGGMSRDGSLVAATFRGDRVDLIHTADGTVAHSLPIPRVEAAAISPDGTHIAVVGVAGEDLRYLRTLDAAAGTASRELQRGGRIPALAFDGQRVVLGYDAHVEVWRVPGQDGTWTVEQVMLGPPYRMLAFVGDGRRLVAVATASVAAWDVDGWRQVLDLPIPSGLGAAFAADGSAVVSGAGFVDLPPLPGRSR